MLGPNATVFAYAAAQVKKAMDVTQLLGGENYVFWGGREGYISLINTDMGLELDNMAR
jgi:xylose isomerase